MTGNVLARFFISLPSSMTTVLPSLKNPIGTHCPPPFRMADQIPGISPESENVNETVYAFHYSRPYTHEMLPLLSCFTNIICIEMKASQPVKLTFFDQFENSEMKHM